MSKTGVRLSIVVPAYNNGRELQECLAALTAAAGPDSEIIVVDDGSTEEIGVPPTAGVTVLRMTKNAGPSSARNLGARHARGEILFFVDSDVVIAPDAVSRVLRVFDESPTVAAVFGSYDKQPRAKGVVSEYRNLLHHYVHQTGSTEASTFWAGCGAIRRAVFEQVGGFDEERFTRYMEDIELGYRLRRAGYRIALDKTIQGTHLKRWTLRSLIRTDVQCRAVPWTRLIVEQKQMPRDLNLKTGQRASAVLVALACMFVLLAPALPSIQFELSALRVAGVAAIVVIVLNLDLYAFFVRERGPLFALGAIPLHLLYFVYSGLTFVCVWCDHRLKSIGARQPLFRATRF